MKFSGGGCAAGAGRSVCPPGEWSAFSSLSIAWLFKAQLAVQVRSVEMSVLSY